MFDKNVGALDWVPIFKLKGQSKEAIIREIKKALKIPYEAENLVYRLGFDNRQPETARIIACEIVALRFCLQDTDFAKDYLSEEDYGKALNQFERKQYSSKLLRELLHVFTHLISCRRNGESCEEEISGLLKLDIIRAERAISEEMAEKAFSPLKRQIEKIASGVKVNCYFAAEKPNYSRGIRKELNDFLAEKYGYELNRIDYYNNHSTEKTFKKVLLDNNEFWAEHETFSVSTFLNSIYELNDEKHAQKVLSYIFDKIKENDIGKKIIENKLSLEYLDEDKVFGWLKDSTLRFFYRFEGLYDLEKIKEDACCYPYTKTEGVEEKIACGREIMNGLFASVYPADSKKVIDFFNAQINGDTPYKLKGYSVKDLFIGFSSCLWYHDSARKAVLVYCSEYFSFENIWSRVYLIAYASAKLEGNRDKCYANLFEIFYDLFKVIEGRFGFKTSYQKDARGRDKAYNNLKNILKNYGITISDKFKDDYITSLLDRKVAVREEIDLFPELEQLGDAVYGLAVAEMMFYQPAELESESIFNDYDKYVCANAQVEICRMLGLEKLYLSPLALSYKYTRDTFVDPDDEIFLLKQEVADNDCKFKFLADCLEMIIGTVCKDCGYQAAIAFTKRIVREKYPDIFKKEIRWENRYEVGPEDWIDGEYWNRIKPTPFLECGDYANYDSRRLIDHMWDALNKFMLAYSLGTGGKEVRTFITHRHSDAKYGDELYGKNTLGSHTTNFAMYDYLHNGLAYVVEKYPAVIKENYKTINN